MNVKLSDGSSAEDLRRWVFALAFGKPVHVNEGFGAIQRFRSTPAIDKAHEVVFTQRFRQRFAELERITSAIAKDRRSKWRVFTEHTRGASSNLRRIDSSASFVRWLNAMKVPSR